MSSLSGDVAAELGADRSVQRLLVANRAEIALRIFRTAEELGIETIAVFTPDEASSPHVAGADEAYELKVTGAKGYLDIDTVLDVAQKAGADAVHPGYGFLSENAEFARRVEAAGMTFIGPRPEALALLGDKIAAKARARELGIPVIDGTLGSTDLSEAKAFFETLPAGASMLIKAISGGGGRGMRIVSKAEDVEDAWRRCRSEAEAAFGDPNVYVEHFLPRARHIEVQVLGDGTGECIAFGERECTLQRRHQKVLEIAPSPSLSPAERDLLINRSLQMAQSVDYRSLGTFEFLMDVDGAQERFFFIEANPRIQVEHTITEEAYGQDLVALQLAIGSGRTLSELGLENAPQPSAGYAVQARVNMEQMDGQGNAMPTSGILQRYEQPGGIGVRVDGFAHAGYRTSASYDSLLAKVIIHSRSPMWPAALRKVDRALRDFRIDGLETNIPWLRALIARPEVQGNDLTTRFIEAHAADLAQAAMEFLPEKASWSPDTAASEAAVHVDIPGADTIRAPMPATVVSVDVEQGMEVAAGQQLAVLEAMKMEHVIAAPASGRIVAVYTAGGQTLVSGAPVLAIERDGEQAASAAADDVIDLDHIRDDLREVQIVHGYGKDESRPDAVAKRHKRGQQTARENLAAVCDEGSFTEFGELAIAAQRQRRTLDDLLQNTSGDGMLTGLGTVNAAEFGENQARCAFAVGDYMVLAGTQGQRHHRKLDRIFHAAGDWGIPLILFAEGGGGRPGDTERATYAGISNPTFSSFARLSGQVPLVGIASGRCFAGNAALLGCCDVIIADESSNIGMAGPAMIEGGGLGVFPPEAIGPIDVQTANGVVDIRVADEAEACRVARKYLGYFQGATSDWGTHDQRRLRHVVPENRLRVYEIREAIETIADVDSVLELRREFGIGIVTALIRIEGKPFGVIANNPRYLGGAIDGPAADKASRFMQLCDSFDLPIVSLCDSPGFMVGPEAEKTALVRHVCRMFVAGRSISVPLFSVVLRKFYGLGAMAMAGGGTFDNFFTVSWPTGEFGPMGLEGAVRLGFRRELEEVSDPAERQALYERLLEEYREQGKAVSVASTFEIDAVIDPVETRKWILSGLRSVRLRPPLSGRKRPFVDTW